MGFFNKSGGYGSLKVYKVTEIIYDITYYFAHHYLQGNDRTVDQMIQAARSGKQNIAEGSKASATSRKIEMNLTNIAKSSLEELMKDYNDYLRVRNLTTWGREHPRFEKMREYVKTDDFNSNYNSLIQRLNDEEIANLCLTLCNQATFMLKSLVESQHNRFVKEGGFSEKLYRERVEYRKQQHVSDGSDRSDRSDKSDRSEQPSEND